MKAFGVIAKLAVSAAAVWPGFIALSPAAGAFAQAVGPQLDELFTGSVASNYQLKAILTPTGDALNAAPPTGDYLTVTFPYAEMQIGSPDVLGSLAIYQSRSASIIIDSNSQTVVTPADILQNQGLGAPHNCLPATGWTGSCGKDTTYFSKAWNTVFDLTGDFKTSNDQKAGPASWSKLFTACSQIRSAAADLALSPIDSLLVRWALLQKAGLIEILENKDGKKNDYIDAISKATILGTSDPSKLCWDQEKDEPALKAIADIAGKKFQPQVP